MPASRADIPTEVAIIGSGPAGLAAAAALARSGTGNIIVVERDEAPGGLPRFCHHPGFGWEYDRRFGTGPSFVRRLLADLPAERIRLLLRTTALRILPGPIVEVVGPEIGCTMLRAKAVLVATGIRERPRGARLVPGSRPEHGILTTGMLQQMVARGVPVRAHRMAVVGSEHVAFSAILTGRRAGLRTVAIVEARDRIQSWTLAHFAAAALGIPLHLRSTVVEIVGREQVEAIAVRHENREIRNIRCDCVLFSGGWVPETILLAESGGQLDPHSGGPIVDQLMRTTLPGVFAAGNVLRAVESSGRAALEGAAGAGCIAALLAQQIAPEIGTARVEAEPPLSYIVPQRWAFENTTIAERAQFSFRASEEIRGQITMMMGGVLAYQGRRMRICSNRQMRFVFGGVDANARATPIRVGVVLRK
jgi:thioredoxin reductase